MSEMTLSTRPPPLFENIKLRGLCWCVTVLVVSDDPAFITTWARVADEGRLLVWTTKVLVVTRLPRLSLHPLMSSHWALANMNVMVVNAEEEEEEKQQPSSLRYSKENQLNKSSLLASCIKY